MTPLEISDYKRSWMPGFIVRLHSDLDWKGKDYCRRKLERHQWSMTSWTQVYEHTFHFEKKEDADAFKETFGRYADQCLDCSHWGSDFCKHCGEDYEG